MKDLLIKTSLDLRSKYFIIFRADLTRMIDSQQKWEADLDIKNAEFDMVGKLKVQFRWI
jgi:hypothetical protein